MKSKFKNAPRVNTAYSSLAMKLTFKREKILNLFGLKSYGTFDKSPLIKFSKSFESSPQKKKKRYLIRFIKRRRWRSLMQNVVNKYLPYSKYKLPKGLPILQDNLYRDSIFLKKMESDYNILLKSKKTK